MLRRASCVLPLVFALLQSCSPQNAEPAAVQETPPPPPQAVTRQVPRQRKPVLSARAESLSTRLVFVPANQSWFLAAARGKRLLIDLGRVDAEVVKDADRAAAYREAVERLSPVPVGSRFRLHGAWGEDDAVVTGFDSWNGRIVATVRTSPTVEGMAAKAAPLVVAARRVDSLTQPVSASCDREPLPPALATRADSVRDSLEIELRLFDAPIHDRLAASTTVQHTRVPGCFGIGRALLVASLRAGGNEYLRERFVVLDDSGKVHPLRSNGLRFRANDALYALDADGDGIDDVATRGIDQRAGALTILRVADGRRLERLTSGFAWESR